jgi:hypothetical protein
MLASSVAQDFDMASVRRQSGRAASASTRAAKPRS